MIYLVYRALLSATECVCSCLAKNGNFYLWYHTYFDWCFWRFSDSVSTTLFIERRIRRVEYREQWACEELAIYMVAYSRYSCGFTEKATKNFRQDSTFRSTNTILVRPKHITGALISSLHYLRMVKNNRKICHDVGDLLHSKKI